MKLKKNKSNGKRQNFNSERFQVDDEIDVRVCNPAEGSPLLQSLKREKRKNPEWFQETSDLVIIGAVRRSQKPLRTADELLNCIKDETTDCDTMFSSMTKFFQQPTTNVFQGQNNTQAVTGQQVLSDIFPAAVTSDNTCDEDSNGTISVNSSPGDLSIRSRESPTDEIKGKYPFIEEPGNDSPIKGEGRNDDDEVSILKVVERSPSSLRKKLQISREMARLHQSLKEISWAKDWDVEKMMTERKSARHVNSRKKMEPDVKIPIKTGGLRPKLDPKSASRNISSAKPKVHNSLSPKCRPTTTNNKSKISPSTKSPQKVPNKDLKTKTINNNRSKCGPQQHSDKKRPAVANGNSPTTKKSKKVTSKNLGLPHKKTASSTVNQSTSNITTKKETDNSNKKGFAVRFDFIENKRSELAIKTESIKEFPVICLKKITEEPIKTNKVVEEDNVLIFDKFVKKEISQMESDLKVHDSKKKKPNDDEESLMMRSSIRKIEYKYKEIYIRKHHNFTQIILSSNISKTRGLTIEGLRELKEAIILGRKDFNSKLILLSNTGNVFCSGVDLNTLICGDLQTAQQMAKAIRDLVEAMAYTSKPVVAAVNGDAVGFGLTLLLYCDVVYASDKATFFMPHSRLGQIPEGAATLRLPQVVGSILSSSMLLRGQRLTASEACLHGLVSEVIWPTRLMEEVIPRVRAITQQPLQGMELTKMLQRSHNLDRLQVALENESKILPKQWLTKTWKNAAQQLIESGGCTL